MILTPKTIHHELSEQLDFTPPCFISNQRAISAINRAHTQKCKQEIANIACLSQNGTLYPKTLPQFCPHKGVFSFHLLFIAINLKNHLFSLKFIFLSYKEFGFTLVLSNLI